MTGRRDIPAPAPGRWLVATTAVLLAGAILVVLAHPNFDLSRAALNDKYVVVLFFGASGAATLMPADTAESWSTLFPLGPARSQSILELACVLQS